MFDFNKINDVIKEEVEKETVVIEELAYKRGYAEGIKTASKREEEAVELSEAEGYLKGLEDFLEAIRDLYLIDQDRRFELFKQIYVKDIILNNHPLEIMKIVNKEKHEDDKKKELIEKVKNSDLDEDIKKALESYIDVNDLVVIHL